MLIQIPGYIRATFGLHSGYIHASIKNLIKNQNVKPKRQPALDLALPILVLPEILGLFKDLFIHFVLVNRRLAVSGQQQDKANRQPGLDVITQIPVGDIWLCHRAVLSRPSILPD
jgi:hypothetical protein